MRTGRSVLAMRLLDGFVPTGLRRKPLRSWRARQDSNYHLDPAAGGEDVNQRLPDEPDIGNDAEADTRPVMGERFGISQNVNTHRMPYIYFLRTASTV